MISVIVPIYHGKKYIPNMISQVECAAMEVEESVELILSNDDPHEKLNAYISSVVKIQVLNTERNKGIHETRVCGLNKAQGNYILFLDQDDKISKDYFKSQRESIQDNDAVICRSIHGDYLAYKEETNLEDFMTLDYFMNNVNPIRSPGQVLIKKSSIPKCWKSNIVQNNGADDWFLWLCMLKQGCSFSVCNKILFEHVLHTNNESFNELGMTKSEEEVYDILEDKNILSEKECASLHKLIKNNTYKRINNAGNIIKKLKINNQMIDFYIRGNQIGKILKKQKISSVAIYGVTELGKHIFNDLYNNGITVSYYIDRNAKQIISDSLVVTMEDIPYRTELIIIAIINDQQEIKDLIRKKLSVKTYTISELLNLS